MVRAFIAVELDNRLRESLAAAGKTLQCGRNVSPVAENNMHITLKFLGEISESKITLVKEAMQKINGEPFTLTASHVSCFGRPPRVIKAEVTDNNNCSKLAAELENLLEAKGFAREEKKFSPHITLARVKNPDAGLNAKIANIAASEFGICTIDKIVLKQSTLTPSGPIYKTLFEVPL